MLIFPKPGTLPDNELKKKIKKILTETVMHTHIQQFDSHQ